MKVILGLFAAAALLGLACSAAAQPPGSYRESCRDIRMRGSTLSAVCRTVRGREQPTALNISRCVGDIGNSNGNLVCNGGQPVRPGAGPAPGYGYAPAPGYPAPGYGPPRYGEEQAYRERCEHLQHEEHELRDRLGDTPYGEERERLEYRLNQVHAEREQCFRR
jgi:CVNH domain